MEREHYKTSKAYLPSVNKIQMRRLSRICRKWVEVKGRSCVSYTTMLLGDRPNPAFDKKKDTNRSIK